MNKPKKVEEKPGGIWEIVQDAYQEGKKGTLQEIIKLVEEMKMGCNYDNKSLEEVEIYRECCDTLLTKLKEI